MGLFGKSFKEKVEEAVAKVDAMGIGVRALRAEVAGKVVTLKGRAADLAAKTRVMNEFNALVETDNTLNLIELDVKPAAPAPAPMPEALPKPAPERVTERFHEVVPGDTLGAIAKTYYGKAGMYMKIFEANRDILTNPDLIKPGQKLRIPE
jgi:nucleoid-associated protein YgaU